MRVLVVEDEEGLGVLIQEHLKRQGFAVDLVEYLEDAHAALSTTPFDAIVLELIAILKARCDALGDTPLDEGVDLADIAMSTVADLFPLAHAKGRNIAFEQTDNPAPLRGNAVLMHGALRNVIENALELTPSGSTVEVRQDATRLHDDQLSADNHAGNGACFTFNFSNPQAM